MKKLLLIMMIFMASVYAIGQKPMQAPVVSEESTTVTLSDIGVRNNLNSPDPGDYLAIWTLPNNGSTSANSRAPSNFFKYQRTEYLITPAEMAASGFPVGSNIQSIGWLIYAAGTGTLTGTLNIYLKNTSDIAYGLGATWTTTGFTQVHNDAAFTVPIALGYYNITLNGATPFTYTGGGVYVAWEFSSTGTVGTVGNSYYCNTNLTNGLYGARSNTAAPTTLAASAWRPATTFGNNDLYDVLAINNVYALGQIASPYGNPSDIRVNMTNGSASGATFDLNVTVSDSATGTTRFTQTLTGQTLAAGATNIFTIPGWSPTDLEKVNITATATASPGENFLFNNTMTAKALVNSNTFSYNYSIVNPGGWGFNTPPAIFLAKYKMAGSGVVSAANIFIYNYANNVNGVVYAVVLNNQGTIVAQSANLTIAAGNMGVFNTFTFPTPPSFCNEDFYVGLAQTTLGTNTGAWYPMGAMSETPVRPNSFYTCSITGGTLNMASSARYAIDAVVAPYTGLCNPTLLTALPASNSQIDLTWVPNFSGDQVMIASGTSSTFGTPVDGTAYPVGSTLPGGGTVIYQGTASGFSHTGLTTGTTYYYRAWSVNPSTLYSPPVSANAATYFIVPYAQDFNAGLTMPPSWTGTMSVQAEHGTSASNGLTYNLYNTATSCNAYSPNVILSANPCRLSFDYRLINWDGYPDTAYIPGLNDKLEIKISTNNGSTWTTLYTINQSNHVPSLSFVTKTFDLSLYTGSIVKIRFQGTWSSGDYYIDIDNFLIEEMPLCATPTALTATNITTSSAAIGWSNASFVEIDFGPTGHAAGSGTIISPIVANPHTIYGLVTNYNYDVYVRQECGTGVYSSWAGPLSFKTLDIISFNPASYSYGSVAIGGSPVQQVFTITNNGPATSLESCYLSGPDMGQYTLTDGSSYPKNLASGASYSVTVTFQPTSTGLKNAYLNVAEPELTPYVANLSGTGLCPAPIDLTATILSTTSAQLGWNANGTSAWEIEYGQAGFTLGTGTQITSGVTNPYTLTGLNQGWTYSFYVRGICNGGNSAWGGPYSFTLPCDPFAVPFTENFDGVTIPSLPLCWSRYSSAALRPWQTMTNLGPKSAPNSVGVYYHSTAPKNEWLVSPPIQVVAGTAYWVKFWVKAPGYAGVPEKLKLVASTDPSLSGLTSAPILWNDPNMFYSDYVEMVVPFTPATSGPYYFAWHAYSVADVDFITMDDVTIMEIPPCVTPNGLSASGMTTTSATLDWTENGTATQWDLEYGAPGFTIGSGTRVSGIAAKPYLLSGLTPSTQYEFVVRANCGNQNYSNWSSASQFETLSAVPENTTVTGTYITGQPVCFNATNTITVAGGGSTFVLQSGGSATFIAGQKILFLPGATVESGAFMHAYIAPGGPWCSTSKIGGATAEGNEIPTAVSTASFIIYPNPTNGDITLVQKSENLVDLVNVEIFNINGAKVMNSTLIGEKQHVFNTSSLPSGIYFVKIVAGNQVENIKLIKTR